MMQRLLRWRTGEGSPYRFGAPLVTLAASASGAHTMQYDATTSSNAHASRHLWKLAEASSAGKDARPVRASSARSSASSTRMYSAVPCPRYGCLCERSGRGTTICTAIHVGRTTDAVPMQTVDNVGDEVGSYSESH